jgi:hypothetical protein
MRASTETITTWRAGSAAGAPAASPRPARSSAIVRLAKRTPTAVAEDSSLAFTITV